MQVTHQDVGVFSPILNFYDAILIMTGVLAILLTLPLLTKREREKRDTLLALFILSQGMIAVYNLVLFSEFIGPRTFALLYPFHFLPLVLLYGAQGFFLLWYAQAMMGERITFRNRSSYLGIVAIVLFGMLGALSAAQFNHFKFNSPGLWVLVLMSILVGTRAIFRLWRYDRQIREHFSNLQGIRLSWLTWYAAGFVAVWALILCGHIAGGLHFKAMANTIGTISNLPPLLLLSGLVVHGQAMSLRNGPIQDKVEKHDRQVDFNQDHKIRLEDLMQRVKIYQDPELRLDGLADSMDLSPRSVSALLNGNYGKSFYDFINHYRIQDACAQLQNPTLEQKTIQQVFEDAGFNAKTTFNTLFKKTTGQTPSEYRKACQRHSAPLDANQSVSCSSPK